MILEAAKVMKPRGELNLDRHAIRCSKAGMTGILRFAAGEREGLVRSPITVGLGLPTERRGLTSDKKNGMLIDPPCGFTGGRSPPSPRTRLRGSGFGLPSFGQSASPKRNTAPIPSVSKRPKVTFVSKPGV